MLVQFVSLFIVFASFECIRNYVWNNEYWNRYHERKMLDDDILVQQREGFNLLTLRAA